MIMNEILPSGMEFIKKIKLRIALSIVITIVGAIAVTMVIGGFLPHGLNDGGNSNDFILGFYTGTGGGLIGAGVVTLIQQLILLKNDEKRKKAELEAKDERNRFIASRTATLTLYIGAAALYISIVTIGLLNSAVATTLLAVLGAMLLLYFIVYIICKKIY